MRIKYANFTNSLPLRVLVIDDNATFRKDIIALLKKQKDVKVIGSTSNGIRSISRFEQLQPDIIFLDITMPRMAGPEIAYNIKRVSPSTKIIYVSYHERNIYPELLKLQRVEGYIQKSSLKNDLPKVLKRFINKKNGRSLPNRFVQCEST